MKALITTLCILMAAAGAFAAEDAKQIGPTVGECRARYPSSGVRGEDEGEGRQRRA